MGRDDDMTPLEVAQKCYQQFDQLTRTMGDAERWESAEELVATLEGVLMERDEQQQ